MKGTSGQVTNFARVVAPGVVTLILLGMSARGTCADLPSMLPPSSVSRLQTLMPKEKKPTARHKLTLEQSMSVYLELTESESELTDVDSLGLVGGLEISDRILEYGKAEAKRAPQATEEERQPVPAMRAAQITAQEFMRRYVPDVEIDAVSKCLGAAGPDNEKVQCVLAKLTVLAADPSFAALSADDQAIVIKAAIALSGGVPEESRMTELTNKQFWDGAVGLLKTWYRVAGSERAVLRQLEKDAEVIAAQLESTVSEFERRRYRLNNSAKRIVELELDSTDPRYKQYVTDARKLLQDQLALESMTKGMIPSDVIDLSNSAVVIQNLSKQLTTSSKNAERLIEEAARGAIQDLIPSVDALPAAAVKALGLPEETTALVDIIKSGEASALLSGPVLEAVGLPPELGGIAVAIGSGNFVGAVAGFADMAGVSLGGLLGGGGGGAEMAEIRKELAEIRQQLAEISVKLNDIDRKLDNLRELVAANHAEVMAKLAILGEDIDAIRRANKDALGRHTRNCDTIINRTMKAKDYGSLERSLDNEKIGPFVRCWETVEDTASQSVLNTIFTLGFSEGAQASRQNYLRKYLAPHVQFFRDAFASQEELERATLLLGAGAHDLHSVELRYRATQTTVPLEGRRLFATSVLDPRQILDYETVEIFFESALLAVSLRPFINLVDNTMISLKCALDESCLKDTAEPNEIQMMEVLDGCLKLAETGVAQTAILDGDLSLPFAVNVIGKPEHESYQYLSDLMKQNEVFASNVAIAVLSDVLAPVGKSSLPPENQLDAPEVQVLGSLYSFAVATASPEMMQRLADSGASGWNLRFFFKKGENAPKACAHTYEGLGLYMILPNGICLPVPTIEEVQRGILRESPDGYTFRKLRSRIMREIMLYNFRKEAPKGIRTVIDGSPLMALN